MSSPALPQIKAQLSTQSYFTMPKSPVLVDDGGDVALKPAINADGVQGTGEMLSSATPFDKMAIGISATINAATKARRTNFTNSVKHREPSSRAFGFRRSFSQNANAPWSRLRLDQ